MELRFPAMRGVMGGKPYYVAMIKMKQVPSLFDTYLERKQKQAEDKEELNLQLEAQRRMNMKRVPEISQYIQRSFGAKTKYTYVFNSITANTETKITFKPISRSSDLGEITIMDLEKFTVADGQHRLMGIKNAYHSMSGKIKQEFGNESIAVVFFDVRDAKSGKPDIKRKHQIFTDLNRNAKSVSGSISYAMGTRPVEQVTRYVIDEFEGFNDLVEWEKTYPSRGSRFLFSAKVIGDSNDILFGKFDYEEVPEKQKKAVAFWKSLHDSLDVWQQVLKKEVDAAEIKGTYLCTHAVVIRSIATVVAKAESTGGRKLVDKVFRQIENFDWRKSNPQLKRRLLQENGSVINSKPAQKELVEFLCKTFDV